MRRQHEPTHAVFAKGWSAASLHGPSLSATHGTCHVFSRLDILIRIFVHRARVAPATGASGGPSKSGGDRGSPARRPQWSAKFTTLLAVSRDMTLLPVLATSVRRAPRSSASCDSIASEMWIVSVATVRELQPWHPVGYTLRRVEVADVVAQEIVAALLGVTWWDGRARTQT